MKLSTLARDLLHAVLAPSRGAARSSTPELRTAAGPVPAPGSSPGLGQSKGPSLARSSSADGGVSAPSAARISVYDDARHGPPTLAYTPDLDGEPDPGEIVWGWVPFEEDDTVGKDRPVLVIGTGGGALVGLQLTSKDHTRDQGRERARGRIWLDIGSGAWDSRGRESEVRLDRVLRVPEAAVRREGAVLGTARFSDVVAALRILHGW